MKQMWQCKFRISWFWLNFALIFHQWGAGGMKLDILAAFNTNSRRLIRIWRSWGLVDARNRKQGWVCVFFCFAKTRCQCKTRKSWFCMIFALILTHNGAQVMKIDILAAFNTNSRCLIRIWRSWGLVGARKRKQGAAGWGSEWGKYVKIWKSGKSCRMGWEWSEELQTGAKWSGQLSECF